MILNRTRADSELAAPAPGWRRRSELLHTSRSTSASWFPAGKMKLGDIRSTPCEMYSSACRRDMPTPRYRVYDFAPETAVRISPACPLDRADRHGDIALPVDLKIGVG